MDIHDLRGVTLGQYQLRELLGVGGMGAVYRAEQSALRRAVAVKVMSAKLTAEPGYVERFYREARIAAQLEHAHIIPVYDYGVQGDISYLVMRLLTGASLMDRLRQSSERRLGLPALGEVSEVLSQLASALDYAHSQGVIHRDIKPNNVMFDNQGSAYLVDFGIAKLLEATSVITNSGVAMGTPLFMPPEQWRSEEISPAADQYALGVMLYLLLTGQAPFLSNTPHGLMYKHLNETPTPVQALRADAPQAVTAVLERAMAKEPAKRFPTVTALAQSFSSAIAGVDSERTNFFIAPVRPTKPAAMTAAPTSQEAQPAAMSGSPVPAAPTTKRPARRVGRVLGVGAVLVIAAVTVVAIVLSRSQGGPSVGVATTPAALAAAVTVTLTATAPEPTRILPASPAPSATATTAPSATALPLSETPAPPSPTPQPTKPPAITPDHSATAIAQQLIALAASLTAVSWTATPTSTLPPTSPPTFAPTLPPATTAIPPTPMLPPATATAQPTNRPTSQPTTILPSGTPTPRTVASADVAAIIQADNAARLIERGSAPAEFTPQDFVLAPDGSRFAIGGNGVAIYDARTMSLLTVMGRGRRAAFNADWSLVAVTDGARVLFLNPATGAELGRIDILTDISGVALSPDGRIAAAATGKVVKILDVSAGSILKTLNVATVVSVSGVRFTPDGAWLVIASDAGIGLWETQTWTEALRLGVERTGVFALSADGGRLAAQQADQIMVWELPTGHPLVSLNGEARALAFSPDNRLLAAAGDDPLVTIWDLETRRALATLSGHTGAIEGLAFAPDGTALYSASADETIKAWALPTS